MLFSPLRHLFISFCGARARAGWWVVGGGLKRWTSCGPRRLISQAFGHRRILLPLCVLRNPPASTFAPSYSGVARDDGDRTVSYNSYLNKPFFLCGWLCPLTLAETPPFLPRPFLLLPCQGSNRGADTSQTPLVEGTAHPRAGTRKRDLERR